MLGRLGSGAGPATTVRAGRTRWARSGTPRTVPRTGRSTPRTGGTAPRTGGTAPWTGGTAPWTGGTAAWTGGTVPGTGRTWRRDPRSRGTDPGSRRSVPRPGFGRAVAVRWPGGDLGHQRSWRPHVRDRREPGRAIGKRGLDPAPPLAAPDAHRGQPADQRHPADARGRRGERKSVGHCRGPRGGPLRRRGVRGSHPAGRDRIDQLADRSGYAQ